MFTPAASSTPRTFAGRALALLTLCGMISLASTAGCRFDKTGADFSDNANDNQNTNANTNSNGNGNVNGNTNTGTCGDGIVDVTDLCDDGNLDPGDGCDDHCTVEVGWQCTSDDPSVCTTVCGDNIVVAGHEACDDGNPADGDGCSALCQVEGFYSCSGNPSDCVCTIYVDVDNTAPTPDGSSWSKSIRSVTDALAKSTDLLISQPACEVWVAAGTYNVYRLSNTDTVTLVSHVGVYGGFTGVETARDQRDWETHRTVLDGHHPTITGSRVQHVVSANGATSATLDGFTVTGGQVSTGLDVDGAGIMLINSDVTVANCVIEDNQNADDGGGLYSEGGSLLLTDSRISNNTSRDDGAGVVVRGVGSTATIRRCLVSGNAGGDRGGGVAVHEGTVTVESSVFWLNRAPRGGGVSLGTMATVNIINCTFSRNQSGASPGGAIRNDSSTLNVKNSILWGDQPEEVETLPGFTTVTHSALETGVVYTGQGNINLDPGFFDVTVSDFHLAPGSPCIDAADSTAAPNLDLEYLGRVDDPGTADTGLGSPPADMGAYEYQP